MLKFKAVFLWTTGISCTLKTNVSWNVCIFSAYFVTPEHCFTLIGQTFYNARMDIVLRSNCCFLSLRAVLFVCKVVSRFANFKEDNRDRVCLCVCVSLASDSSETVEVISVNHGTVTASDMRMHHVLIILTDVHSRSYTSKS